MDELKLKFELTMSESNTILAALGELPAKVTMNLIQKMQQQAAPQLPATDSVDNQSQGE